MPSLASERAEIVAILGVSEEAAQALQDRYGGADRCLDEWFSILNKITLFLLIVTLA
jgi:hypothetical protein